MDSENGGGLKPGHLAAAIVVPLMVVLLLASSAILVISRLRQHRGLSGKVLAPKASPSTCLVMVSVPGLQVLEQDLPAGLVDEALTALEACMRSLLPQYSGYESTSKGKGLYLLAFHSPMNATKFASALQVRLRYAMLVYIVPAKKVCRLDRSAATSCFVECGWHLLL